MAWSAYCLFSFSVAACRNGARHTYGIAGSVWIDVLLSLLCYPLVICQISAQEISVTDDPQFAQVSGPPPHPTSPVPLEPPDQIIQYSSREAKLERPERLLYASGPAVADRRLFSSQPSSSGGADPAVSRLQARQHEGVWREGQGGEWNVTHAPPPQQHLLDSVVNNNHSSYRTTSSAAEDTSPDSLAPATFYPDGSYPYGHADVDMGVA